MWWLEPPNALPAWQRATTAVAPDRELRVPPLSRFPLPGGQVALVDSDTGGWCVTDDVEAGLLTEGRRFSNAIGSAWTTQAWRRGLLRDGDRHVLGDADLAGEAAACRDTYGLVLLLNGGCNLVCTYCYLGHETPSKKRMIDLSLAEEAIRSALQRPEEQIIVDLGEIAVSNPHWRHLATYTREVAASSPGEVRLTVQTNGTTLDQSSVDFLAQHEVTVGLSLDGPARHHDRARMFRTGAGSHELAVRALERCAKTGVSTHLIATVARHNVAVPELVVGELLSHRPGSYLLKPVLAHGEAATAWDREGVTSDEYASFMERAIRAAVESGGALDQSAAKFAQRLLGERRGWADGCTSRQCGSGRSLHVVASDGEVFACPRFVTGGTGFRPPGRLSLPLLLADSLRAVPESCAGCPWLRSCGGGCTLSGHDGTRGTVPLPDPQCTAYQVMHEVLLRQVIAPAALGADGLVNGRVKRCSVRPDHLIESESR
ncbi:radical SAM protein [Lentzea sp. NBRC 102530]|uniref:radical SAM protein n=1 Tax=Lentzea sp. NBRC 102530 TaxID=3032201 RepID=UPI0024A0C568|nr:radical SAM protein [Lentzea sp. NBRC 102530]GLY50573.1 hypothetical protein Lesp01_42290 [Lentzea sp. NBRC 102530]